MGENGKFRLLSVLWQLQIAQISERPIGYRARAVRPRNPLRLRPLR